MATTWEFFVFPEIGDGFIAHRWSWRDIGRAKPKESAEGFTTLAAAQADAAKHGFTAGDEVIIDSLAARKRLLI